MTSSSTLTPVSTNLYPYKVKECNTRQEIMDAMNYYNVQLERQDLTSVHEHNMKQMYDGLVDKLLKLINREEAVPLYDLLPAPIYREKAYFEMIRQVPKFLDVIDNPEGVDLSFVTQCFSLWINILNQHNLYWTDAMLSESFKFPSQRPKEMVAYLLANVLESGLHHPKQVIKQINLCIKLVYRLKLENSIGVILTNPKKYIHERVVDLK